MSYTILNNINEQVNKIFVEPVKRFRENNLQYKRQELEENLKYAHIANNDIWLNLIGSYYSVTNKQIENIAKVLYDNYQNGKNMSVADVCNEAGLGKIPKKEFSDFLDEQRNNHKFLNNVGFNYDFSDKVSEISSIPNGLVIDIVGHRVEYKNNRIVSYDNNILYDQTILSDIYTLVINSALQEEAILVPSGHHYREFFITTAGRLFRGVTWSLFKNDILPYMEKDDLVIAHKGIKGHDFNRPYLTKKTSTN